MSDLEFVKKKILAKVPLASLIGETVSLVVRSGRPMGCCPFHQEKSPSFYIYDQRYYCFGCKEHGDAINFVRKTMGLSFMEALRHLAQKYSIDAPELQKSQVDWTKARSEHELFQIMAEAQAFFARELFLPQGLQAKNYLLGRGFKEEELKKWGFGLTPHEGYGLTRYLRQRGYSEAQLVDLALSYESQDPGKKPYDFFRNRIMIPIHDIQGRIVAFGGRALDKDPAKYKNSRETRLFNKSDVLFGLHEARQHIRAKGRVIVVEGYMDALRLWSQGFYETVACMGTSLTSSHMQRLKALTGLVVLVFDGDQAGHRATLKAVDVTLGEPSVIVKAVRLPEQLDPDDFVNQKGAASFEDLLSESVYLLDFAIREKLAGQFPHTAAAIAKDEIIPWLAKVTDPLLRDSLVVKVANHLGTSREKLQSQLPRFEDQKAFQALSHMSQESHVHSSHRSDHVTLSVSENPGVSSVLVSQSLAHITRIDMSVAISDLVAHLYLSTPEEVQGKLESLRREIFDTVELPELIQFFIDEILSFLTGGDAPASVSPERWQGLQSPAIADLRAKVMKNSEAFRTSNRLAQIHKILLHFKMDKIKKTLSSLRSEASRLSRQPDCRAELVQVMQTIRSMEEERMQVFQKMQP